MKNLKIIPLLIGLIFTLVACGNNKAASVGEPKVKTVNFQRKYKLKSVPTLFFHGALSNYRAETNITKAAKLIGITNSITRIDVSPDGKVKFIGTIKKNAINPIIEVNYKNNIQFDFAKAGMYATNVIKALKQKYGISQINVVAHSLGNMSVMYYLIQNYHKNMPKINKQVAIAGHFNGVALKQTLQNLRAPDNLKLSASGKPNKMNQAYKQMLILRKIYPQERTKVLNIVGDKGKASDGLVPNASSESLKYLLGSDSNNYQVKKYYGPKADHGRLTYNRQVIRDVINFLWR
ncbi:putative alpha/beta hydrolase family protein [Lactobacillus colini]|uniref:Alpha/beta hydrolase family protein n=1 Tax=Lactobacillus colini TaxID=1819254 RepID=A0ABS4MGU6_9LACO|nr:alpha/beta hydrolase [Lactobacillus colini]MBP2058917.1 putative alpha/beta hydrolase family protein [Lactobacillus colini]